MTPRAIVQVALDKGLDMIAVCDHNSARNVAATQRAARGTRLRVLPGLEITSSEEVHILGLFRSEDEAQAVQDEVYAHLFGENREEVFGYQVVADEFDDVEDLDQRLLIGATTLSAEEVADLIHRFGGLAVASHVDRASFGIFSQLGFIPETVKLDALEVSRQSNFDMVRERFPQARGYGLIASSDAHYLRDIAAVVSLARMAEPTFEELRKALAGEEGRAIVEERVK
jgi:3',5'-nucleoside bisphosphate phosphatase